MTVIALSTKGSPIGIVEKKAKKCRCKIRFNAGTHGSTKTPDSKSGAFQFMRPRRVRPIRLLPSVVGVLFQSTHPRRVRQFSPRLRLSRYRFNPRTPQRVRPPVPKPCGTYVEFQSTHPRRVRLKYVSSHAIMLLFQSTHPRRGRLYFKFNNTNPLRVSIHAPSRGATAKGLFYSHFCLYLWRYIPTDTVYSY